MALYQTGIPVDFPDLLDKLKDFAVANGWTLNGGFTPTANTFVGAAPGNVDNVLMLSKSGVYVILHDSSYATVSTDRDGAAFTGPDIRLYIRQATGYDVGQDHLNQPGDCGYECWDQHFNLSIGAYHFFTNATGDYIHVVLEMPQGRVQHFGFGTVQKVGSYTGGSYVYVNYMREDVTYYQSTTTNEHAFFLDEAWWNSGNRGATVRCDVDAKTWFVFNSHSSHLANFARADCRVGSLSESLIRFAGPNWFNGTAAMIPMHVRVARGADQYSPIGSIKDFRVLDIQNLNVPGSVTYGSDEWLIFPFRRKHYVGATVTTTGNLGVAYKKNTP